MSASRTSLTAQVVGGSGIDPDTTPGAPLLPAVGLTVAAFVATILSLAATVVSEDAYYLFFGALVFLGTVAPAAIFRQRGLNGWDLVIVTAVPLVLLRAWFQFTGGPEGVDIAREFPYPSQLSGAVPAAFELSLGTALIGFGFCRAATRRCAARWQLNWGQDSRIAVRLSATLAVVAVVSFAIYVRETGGLSLADLSSKRTLADADVSSVARVIAVPAGFGVWSLLLYLEHVGARSIFGRPIRIAIVGGLFLLTLIPAVYVSSRTQLITAVVSVVAMRYLKVGSVRVRPVLGLAAVLLVLLGTVSQLRSTQNDQLADLDLSPVETISSLVVNRNYADVSKHYLISTAIAEDTASIEMGRTYQGLLFFWVPRSVWIDKPDVSPGPRFQEVAYGEDSRGGIPPGGITELRWNFGLVGMLLLAFPLGLALGRLDAFLRQSVQGGAVLYCGLGLAIAVQFLAESLVQAALTLLVTSVLLGALLFSFGARARRL